MIEKKQRGGKRDGAGRKPTNKEPTTIIRVPVSVAEQLKQGDLNTVTESKQPEQACAFSYEDLQEQARLIERLTKENQHLKAELSLKNKVKANTEPSTLDLLSVDKIELLNLLKQLENRERPKTFRHSWNHAGCECFTAQGKLCKNIAEDVLVAELRLEVCKVHYQKYKNLETL